MAYITRELVVRIRGLKGEMELVHVKLICEGQRHDSAEHMQIKSTGFAMVGEALALFPTSIAYEMAIAIGGLGEEGESVFLVRRVGHLTRHFEAVLVEVVVADCAGIEHTGGLELASRAR